VSACPGKRAVTEALGVAGLLSVEAVTVFA